MSVFDADTTVLPALRADAEFDVCVLGSANLDLVATVDRLPGPGETVSGSGYAEYPGGKGLNQAVAAARCGASTAFVGAVGRDSAASVLLQVMAAERIDDRWVARVDVPTGRALIGVAAGGENSIIVVPGANGTVGGDASPAPTARVLLAQLEVPVAAVREALAAARAGGTLTVLNPAPAHVLDDDLLRCCDLVVPNEHEAELLGGVEHLLELGARAVVVTQGARGATLHTAGTVVPIAPFAVEAVDTTGAGDTFCGALCARLAAGEALLPALRFGAAAGALCTTRRGAVPSIPSLAEVLGLLSAG
jgi:ribokinase